MSHVDRHKRVVLLDIGCQGGRRRDELVAAVFELVGARKIVFFFGIKLFGAVSLIKPYNANSVGIVANDALCNIEAASVGAVSADAVDFALNDDFAGFDVGDFGRHFKGVVVAREVVEKIPHGFDAGFF